MKLVVANDDGIDVPGIWALARELSKLGQVAVYAPTRNFSGAGMSVRLERAARLSRAAPPPDVDPDIPAFTLEAPPASLAAVGTVHAFGGKVDALVSGINPGWNPGEEPYKVSGTAGAAQVAVERGLLGVAVSAEYFAAPGQFGDIAVATRRLLGAIRAAFDPLPNVLVNVNVPEDFGKDTPVRLTAPTPNTMFSEFRLEECKADAQGVDLRFEFGSYFDREPTPGDEMHALAEGVVSIAVTGQRPSEVLMNEPWPDVVREFRA